MKAIKISFNLDRLHLPHSQTAVFTYDQEILTFSCAFDGHDEPLRVVAKAEEGDQISAVFFSYRIELYVNDELKDEEWPHGDYLADLTNFRNTPTDFVVEEVTETDYNSLPSVIDTFSDASNWIPAENVFIGDCMPYTDSGRYHVLYLKDRRQHKSKWGKGAHQWEHISTDDFSTWQIHPMAVSIDEPNEGSICTGSHIVRDGKHYLYYTIRTMDGSPAPICRSISFDGYHFQKDKSFSFFLSEKYRGSSARDPKIVLDSNGLFHMFITTTYLPKELGCLVHLTSEDLDNWHEEEVPIYVSKSKEEPECPDYFEFNGKYYLIFSIKGKGLYLVSDKPFSDFKEPSNALIPCESVPKASIFNGKIIFTGFRGNGGYGGTLALRCATQDKDGNLIFE